jgi:integration host factor subunit beta
MIKSELIAKIAEQNSHLYQRDAEAVVNAILDTIKVALARGDRVELRGFGMFTVKQREAYVGRNPRNRKQVAVAEKLVPMFKMSRIMRSLLNPGDALRAPARPHGAAPRQR